MAGKRLRFLNYLKVNLIKSGDFVDQNPQPHLTRQQYRQQRRNQLKYRGTGREGWSSERKVKRLAHHLNVMIFVLVLFITVIYLILFLVNF